MQILLRGDIVTLGLKKGRDRFCNRKRGIKEGLKQERRMLVRWIEGVDIDGV